LNLSGGNPYDPGQLLQLQKSTGKPGEEAVMMWNPPWVLALVMPVSILDFEISHALWLLLNLFLVITSASLIWSIYRGPSQLVWMSWIISFTFLPVLDVLKKGQIGIFLMVGAVGYLYYSSKRRQDLIAGAFLALLSIKPHVLYLFGVAAVLWAIDRGRWNVLLGSVITIAGAAFFTWAINPNVIDQYYFAVRNYPPTDWATPTVGGILRLLIGSENIWLQFLPSILGLLWFTIVFWPRHRKTWDWLDQGPLLVLLSLTTTSYGWSFDQPPALLAILQVTLLIVLHARLDAPVRWIIASYVFILVLNLLTRGNDFFLFWFAPAMIVWYLASVKILRKTAKIEQQSLTEPKILTPE
jgi:hypothetical protein